MYNKRQVLLAVSKKRNELHKLGLGSWRHLSENKIECGTGHTTLLTATRKPNGKLWKIIGKR